MGIFRGFFAGWDDTGVRVLGDGTAKLWDVASREAIATLYPHRSGVTSVDFSPDGKTLAGTSRGAIVLWDVASGEVIAVLAVGGRHGPRFASYSRRMGPPWLPD